MVSLIICRAHKCPKGSSCAQDVDVIYRICVSLRKFTAKVWSVIFVGITRSDATAMLSPFVGLDHAISCCNYFFLNFHHFMVNSLCISTQNVVDNLINQGCSNASAI